MVQELNVSQFDRDVSHNQGYIYTTNKKLSSSLANRRQSDAIHQMVDLKGKKVLDVGCGDGTYTLEFLEQKPSVLFGVDASHMAIQAARKKSSKRKNVHFRVMDVYQIASMKERFDVVIVRGVLHHLYDAPKAIEALSRITEEMVVIEPNGYNPILKLIERFSSYHVEHEEKSYFPGTLKVWFGKNGGNVIHSFYCGLVPFFCPDWMAKFLKVIEPMVEKTPLLKQLSCAVCVFRISIVKKSAMK